MTSFQELRTLQAWTGENYVKGLTLCGTPPEKVGGREMITTAIVYPNNRIHVGFAWEVLGADWLNRSLKLFGQKTYFLTGTDEHALKVQKTAEARGLTPKAHCDEMARDIESVLKKMGVQFDRFIRTSDSDHQEVVRLLVERAFQAGDIYEARYEGHYCEGCEAFYTDKDLVEGLCPAHKTKPKWIQEENFFFRLSKYQARLERLFQEYPDFLMPESRRSEILNFIQAGLRDFSISRSNFTWGIPFPRGEKHLVYVWFDALINYLTGAGVLPWLRGEGTETFEALWPPKVHIIGKDVGRFHAVFWPAMLWSLGFEIPRQVFAHGFLSLRGERLSKSSGHMITPDEIIALTHSDALRYYLLSENSFEGDGNFIFEGLLAKVNADLSNDWGNLVNRTLNMTRKYFPGEALRSEVTDLEDADFFEVRESFLSFRMELASAVKKLDSQSYARSCQARSRVLNLFIDRTKPWAIAKEASPQSLLRLRKVLATLLEGIYWTAVAWQPLLTEGMSRVFQQLSQPVPESLGSLAQLSWGAREFRVGEPAPIYPRLELPKEGGPA
jgi:methionyl-tRNA synthetase